MISLESCKTRATGSRANVAKRYDALRKIEAMDRAASKAIPERAAARQGRGNGKSRRGPLVSSVAVAILIVLVVFLTGTDICQACGIFTSLQQTAGSVPAPEADENTFVGVVGPVSGAGNKTGSVWVRTKLGAAKAPTKISSVTAQTQESVDEAALRQWQMSDSAPQVSPKQYNYVTPAPVNYLPSAQGYKQAVPGFTFEFPRDHSSHNQYKSEWWYYSGHLQSAEGKTYGYELTFFRLGGDYEPNNPKSAWKGENYNVAHFTVTDECGKSFFVDEKTSHSRVATAGASSDRCHVQNEGWSVKRMGDDFVLDAQSTKYSIHLLLDSKKPPIIHGVNGFCLKSQRTGEGTYYYSMTRLETKGQLLIGNRPVEVTGLSWMDHEFGSYKLTPEQCGWDWYSLQLNDNRELMICLIRHLDGSLEPTSCGTIVDARGNSRHLTLADFGVINHGSWHSDKSGGTYPMGWQVSVPSENLDLTLTTRVKAQEINAAAPIGVTYWEGAVQLEGFSNGKRVTGQGYTEMTGYCESHKQSIF